jgi:hypothetical protein
MLKTVIIALAVTTCFFSCKKDTANNNPNQPANTWTFTAAGKVYEGTLYFDAILNTLLQGNNSYTFSLIGEEKTSRHVFNIVMSLADTTFTAPNYQSGVSGTGYITAFYYTETIAGVDIFTSSNYDPGPIMNYTIQSYDPATKTLIFNFSGNAKDKTGKLTPITNGKVTCKIEKI